MSAVESNGAPDSSPYQLEVARARHAQVAPARRLAPRSWLSLLLILFDVATLVLTLGNVHGTSRFVLGLLFGLLVPGWCIIGWLKLNNPALEFSLTVATSLAMLTVVAQVLETIHEWHLFGLQVIACLACLPILTAEFLSFRQSRR